MCSKMLAPSLPPNPQQNYAAKAIDTANAPVCYFHQTFGDKARTCRSPCAFSYGNCKRVVDVGLKREYPWKFIVADVQQPIIGANFLIHYNLLVDLRSRCLRDMRTGPAIAASLSSITPLSLNRVDTVQNEYTKLLGQFPELTRPTTKGETVKHGITHKIVTKRHPVFARPRRLAPDKLVTAKRKFDEMIKLEVTRQRVVLSAWHGAKEKWRLETMWGLP